jgi:hypothetical protein
MKLFDQTRFQLQSSSPTPIFKPPNLPVRHCMLDTLLTLQRLNLSSEDPVAASSLRETIGVVKSCHPTPIVPAIQSLAMSLDITIEPDSESLSEDENGRDVSDQSNRGYNDLGSIPVVHSPSDASDNDETPRPDSRTRSRDHHSTSFIRSRASSYTRSRPKAEAVPHAYQYQLPPLPPPLQAPFQNPYYAPSAGTHYLPQGYPYPQPAYYPTGYPNYHHHSPYNILQNPVSHLGNLNQIGNGLNFINVRNINGKVPDQDLKEVQPRFARTLSFFKGDDDAGPTTDSHQIRQTRCISGPEEGDHDVVVLTTEDAMDVQGELVSGSRWMYVDTTPDHSLEVEVHTHLETLRHIESDALELETFEVSCEAQNPFKCEFDKRKSEVLRSGVSDDETSLLLGLFKHLRSNSEKEFIYGRYLEPTVITLIGVDPGAPYNANCEQKSVTFISLPYLSLEASTPRRFTDSSPLHPVRGLLQSHYVLESMERRDKNQVIHKLGMKRQAVHVPQVWCLLVNKGKDPGPVDVCEKLSYNR